MVTEKRYRDNSETLSGIVKGYDRLTFRPEGSYSHHPNTEEHIAISRKHFTGLRPSRLDLNRLYAKTEDIADRVFENGYKMRVNDSHYHARGPESVVIDLDVAPGGRTRGTLEVYIGKRYQSNIDSSIKFICNLAEYVGTDVGKTRQELMLQAREELPDIKARGATQKAVISLTDGLAQISFQTTNTTDYIKADTGEFQANMTDYSDPDPTVVLRKGA